MRRSRVSAGRVPALIGALAFTALASAAFSQQAVSPPAYVHRPESDLLLLELRLGPAVLADALPAFAVPGGVVLPLGEVCRALDLAITVDVSRGTADGFFISEGRRFFLDAVAGRVLVEGVAKRFDGTRVEIHQDDIYVDAQLLSEWLPVDLAVDLYGAIVSVRPREALPIQRRQEREQRMRKDLRSLGYSGPGYPRIENPYRLFDFPFVDQTLRTTSTPKSGGGRHQSVQYSTFATGDLLLHEASAYLIGDEHGISDSRVTIGRRDPNAELLGPFRAREYAGGNVLDPGLELVSQPRSGNGFLVSSYPLARQSQFDRHTFRGDLPQGWEVELYQNGALIGFQRSGPDGLYEFNDVPLLFGLNLFRLVFYGPQGQRREESHRFNVAEALTPPKTLYYRVVGNDPEGAGRRAHVEADYGLSRHVTTTARIASLEIDRTTRRYGSAGLRGYWDLLFADVQGAWTGDGGSVISAGIQTRLGPLGIAIRHAFLRDFQSEIFRPQFGPIRSRTSARLDAVVPFPVVSQIPVAVDFSEDRLESGQSVDRLTGRLSAYFRGFFVSNLVDWTFGRGTPRRVENAATGNLLISKFVRNLGLRGELVYEMQPSSRVTNAVLTAQTLLFPRYFVEAGISRAFASRQTHFLLSVTRTEGPFGFGANLDWSRPGGWSVAVTLNASIVRDPRTGRWHTQARSVAGLGAASPVAFLDANGNGVRDPGERPFDGVGFTVNQTSVVDRTNSEGTALVTGLPVYQGVDLGVSSATLEDPLAVPVRPGVRFVPRPGRVTEVEFPILISGEVTGTARLRRGGETREAAGVQVQLLDANGKVVREVRTAYDGFYDLTLIVPGRYTIRVSPEQAARLGLSAPAPRDVSISPAGTILDGIDLLLEEAGRPPADR